MFPAVCKKFTHAMGPDTMIPAESIDAAQDLGMLKVVVRKTKRQYLFWKKYKHVVYDFQLENLLQNSHVLLSVDSELKEFCQYSPESKYSLSGKIGVQLMKELMDASLSASDSVTISSKLGTINERELHSESLLDALSNRKVNMDHTFVKQILDPNNVLCVVKTLYCVKNDAEIKRVQEVDGEISMDDKEKVPVAGDLDSKTHVGNTHDIIVPAGTPIAYKVWELKVASDGTILPMVTQSGRGGFTSSVDRSDSSGIETDSDNIDGGKQTQRIEDILRPVTAMSGKERQDFNCLIIQSMSNNTVSQYLSHLLENIEDQKVKCVPIPDIEKATSSGADLCMRILSVCGFQNKEPDKLTAPSEPGPLFTVVTYLFGILEDVRDEEINLMSTCGEEAGTILVQMCSQCVNGQRLIRLQNLSKTLQDGTSANSLSKLMGFRLDLKEDTVFGPEIITSSFEKLYWLLYALYK